MLLNTPMMIPAATPSSIRTAEAGSKPPSVDPEPWKISTKPRSAKKTKNNPVQHPFIYFRSKMHAEIGTKKRPRQKVEDNGPGISDLRERNGGSAKYKGKTDGDQTDSQVNNDGVKRGELKKADKNRQAKFRPA